MTRRRKKPLKAGKSPARNVPPFAHEFRLKVAWLYVEDGYPAKLIAAQFGIGEYSVYRRGKNYHLCGEQGLADKPKTSTGSKLPEVVSQSSVDLKKENPGYGARRIRDTLKFFFFEGTSESTVQRTLRAQGLSQPAKRKSEKILTNIGFFKWARSNQMWQSEIMTFRLACKNAYLNCYFDDIPSQALPQYVFFHPKREHNPILRRVPWASQPSRRPGLSDTRLALNSS